MSKFFFFFFKHKGTTEFLGLIFAYGCVSSCGDGAGNSGKEASGKLSCSVLGYHPLDF